LAPGLRRSRVPGLEPRRRRPGRPGRAADPAAPWHRPRRRSPPSPPARGPRRRAPGPSSHPLLAARPASG
jgi:hypothetical protein